MTPGRRYLAGVALVATVGALIGMVLREPARSGLLLALGIALTAQVPLGWWLIRSVGRPKLLMVWMVGMMVRLGLLGLLGLVILPALGWPLGPALIGFTALLLALLAVESVVLLLGRSTIEER